jgi:hypothetical protein
MSQLTIDSLLSETAFSEILFPNAAFHYLPIIFLSFSVDHVFFL